MAETIPGGRYISEDGKTIHDANGKVIKVITKMIEPAQDEPAQDKPAEYAKEPETKPLEVKEAPPAPMVSPRTGETASTPHRLTKSRSKKAK